MPRKPIFTDLELILLSTAFARDDGHLLPVTDSIAGKTQEVADALAALLKRKLIARAPAPDAARMWKRQAEAAIGLVITDEARALVDGGAVEGAAAVTAPPAPRTGSKIETVLALLGREEGASSAELIDATGWLPHTMRAALTGLRKKGHVIERGDRGDVRVYRRVDAA